MFEKSFDALYSGGCQQNLLHKEREFTGYFEISKNIKQGIIKLEASLERINHSSSKEGSGRVVIRQFGIETHNLSETNKNFPIQNIPKGRVEFNAFIKPYYQLCSAGNDGSGIQ